MQQHTIMCEVCRVTNMRTENHYYLNCEPQGLEILIDRSTQPYVFGTVVSTLQMRKVNSMP